MRLLVLPLLLLPLVALLSRQISLALLIRFLFLPKVLCLVSFFLSILTPPNLSLVEALPFFTH